MEIKETLNRRGDRYGAFAANAEVTERLEEIFWATHQHAPIPPYLRQGIHMILHKLSRAACGDLYYQDNYRDIAGYATLICEELNSGKYGS